MTNWKTIEEETRNHKEAAKRRIRTKYRFRIKERPEGSNMLHDPHDYEIHTPSHRCYIFWQDRSTLESLGPTLIYSTPLSAVSNYRLVTNVRCT